MGIHFSRFRLSLRFFSIIDFAIVAVTQSTHLSAIVRLFNTYSLFCLLLEKNSFN
jgi:hypothetical protein